MRVSLFAFWFHASACGGKSRALREAPPAALRFIFDGSTTHAVSVDNNLRKPTRGACYNKAKRGKSARRRMMMANILIVEDDATIRQLTAMQLSLVGHQCLEAQDGVQMREQLAACTPEYSYYQEFNIEPRPLQEQFLTQQYRLTNGKFRVPDLPGLGAPLDVEKLHRIAICVE